MVLSFFLSFADAHAQIWSSIKEKAGAFSNKMRSASQDAWNSDTRKNAWSKTKEVSSKALGSHQYTVPITERKFINIIPDSKMNSMGGSSYRSFMKRATPSKNSVRTAQVKRVAKRLAEAAEELCEENGVTSDFDWEFNLVKSKQINAWCMPGGKIVVYEGILPVANDDASLAIVLGHEIGHAIAKHSAEQMTKSIITAVGVTWVYMVINNSDMSYRKKMLTKLIASAGATLTTLKFSRIDETEADRLGLILAAKAGYDPHKAISFWKKMRNATGNKGKHDWYSTHPSNTNRIANIQSFIPEAMEYYRKP